MVVNLDKAKFEENMAEEVQCIDIEVGIEVDIELGIEVGIEVDIEVDIEVGIEVGIEVDIVYVEVVENIVADSVEVAVNCYKNPKICRLGIDNSKFIRP